MISVHHLYTICGVVMVALGAVGIVLPLLPTTPFLLLAAFFFSKGSRRMHDWLLGHRRLGPYIRAFRDKTGLTAAQKARIIASFTILLGIGFYYAPTQALRTLIATIWVFWIVVLMCMKSPERSAEHAAAGEGDADPVLDRDETPSGV